MKKILVLTDFSECAGMAVRASMDIALRNEAQIHFLHCKSVPYNWVHLPDIENKLYQDVTDQVNTIKSKLKELVHKAEERGIQANQSVCFNEDNYAVVEYIKDHDMDIVMMGSNGAKGMKEAFLGSNAQKVVRYSDVPVFVVKSEFKYMNDPHFVFVSDFDLECIDAYDQVLEVTKMMNAKVDLIFINTPTYFEESWEIKHRMEKFILKSEALLENHEIIDADNFERGIKSYCHDKTNTIIAMATHGRTGIARLLTGSKTEDVINHIDNTVLSLHI